MAFKNPVALQFYIEKEERDKFRDLCCELDIDMSKELRRFVRGYIKKPPSNAFDLSFNSPTKDD